ncbi:helix-turn-helix domain-containing protein [Desertihabitans aurantiacus]|uniref:helix-turn-helix domain-containing protein n=1 Tax=Desertihabitans aurantiacus TaxID=2282477 RepID=UPI001E5DF8BA|nr:helix-turn-helix domain-containing protein [Desertihabitans aurantiacus]
MRAPLTLIPKVPRLVGGRLAESAGYRVLRPQGTTDWLLVHTRGGRGRFGRPDGPDVLAEPGTVTLLAPGTPHDYGVEDELRSWDIMFCHVHPRPEWSVLLDWPSPAPGIGQLHLDAALQERTLQSWDTAVYWLRSGLPRAELFAMNALELILLCYDGQNPRAIPLDPRIRTVLEHVDQHLGEPLDVSDLALVAHLSPSRFAHLFSDQLGMSPSRYVERQRIAQGRLLLEHTRRPVAEIARAVGFSDPPYFSTRFKRLVGVTPLRYRQGAR